MPDETGTEFWRSIPAIENVFKPDAAPELYIGGASSTEDERYYVPFNETVFSRPLFISIQQNIWCDILLAKGPGLMNRHYHPHGVYAYTISGKWGYLEHDWIATAGDFIYEPPGEGHTLVAYDTDEWTRVHFKVQGPLIWLDDQGNASGYFDVHDYVAMAREHYAKVGLGADFVDTLIR